MLLLLAVPARAGWLEEFAAGKFAVVDLTHTMAVGMPSFSGQPNYLQELSAEYKRGFAMNSLLMLEHAGTHMDAPAHLIQGGQEVSDLKLQNLWAPLFIINIASKSEKNAGYQMSPVDILDFEKNHGKIPAGGFVVASTGWDKHWSNPDRYRNVVNGTMLFPTFSSETADLLLAREIAGIGIDTLSPDGPDSEFPVHHKILGAGKVILENLNNLSKVPHTGASIMALPLKIKGGAESPVRAVAIIK